MRAGTKERIFHYFTLVILAVIVIGGLSVAYPQWRQRESLKRQDAELRRQIEAKNREISQLKKNQRRFQTDPDFVEAIARKNRRVFPGELVFIFED